MSVIERNDEKSILFILGEITQTNSPSKQQISDHGSDHTITHLNKLLSTEFTGRLSFKVSEISFERSSHGSQLQQSLD